MNPTASDALVFFGATGDLAYKKIFPALQSMVKRGRLNVPVIGVAGRSWTSDQLRARARDSLKHHDQVFSVLGKNRANCSKPRSSRGRPR
jgi:glucose-6-phosphate 1-dehydrogenase